MEAVPGNTAHEEKHVAVRDGIDLSSTGASVVSGVAIFFQDVAVRKVIRVGAALAEGLDAGLHHTQILPLADGNQPLFAGLDIAERTASGFGVSRLEPRQVH